MCVRCAKSRTPLDRGGFFHYRLPLEQKSFIQHEVYCATVMRVVTWRRLAHRSPGIKFYTTKGVRRNFITENKIMSRRTYNCTRVYYITVGGGGGRSGDGCGGGGAELDDPAKWLISHKRYNIDWAPQMRSLINWH